MYERKVCLSCLLVSNNHTSVCKRCSYNQFSTIDDYVDQDCLNNENIEVIKHLEDLIAEIKSATRAFSKDWVHNWDTDKDVILEMSFCDDQIDYRYLLDK